jgi:hypothetical protein
MREAKDSSAIENISNYYINTALYPILTAEDDHGVTMP